MKKLWLKILLGVLALGGIGLGLVLFNLNPILESLRPGIEKAISEKLGRDVGVGGLSLTLFPSVAVEVSDVKFREAAGVESGIRKLILKTQLMPLFSRRLEVDEAGIDGLVVHAVRAADKTVTINGIPADKKPPPAEKPAAGDDDAKKKVAIEIKNSWLKNSRLVWRDESVEPKQEIVLENLSGEFKAFSQNGLGSFQIAGQLLGKAESNLIVSGGGGATGEFKLAWNDFDLARVTAIAAAYGVKLEPAVLSDTATLGGSIDFADTPGGDAKLSIELNGTPARIVYGTAFIKEKSIPLTFKTNIAANIGDILTGRLEAKDNHFTIGEIELDTPITAAPAEGRFTVKIHSKQFPLGGLGALVPAVRPYQLKGNLLPDITLQIAEKKTHSLSGGADIKSASVVIPKEGGEPLALADINGRIELTKEATVLQPTKVGLFGGTATVQGSFSNEKTIAAQVMGAGIDLKQLTAYASPGGKVAMTGTLTKLEFRGSGPAADFGGQLSGSIGAEAVKGTIEGFNVLGQTLGKINKIPGLGATLLALIPEKHRPIVEADSTSFDKLTIGAVMSGKNIKLTNVRLDHSLYAVTGEGEIKADGDMTVNAQLRLTENLAGGMLEKERKLSLLLDPARSLVIPVVIARKGGIWVVLPDVTHLGKLALQNSATDAASRALEKVAPGLGDKIAPGLGKTLDSLFK